MQHEEQLWVGLIHGIHDLTLDTQLSVFLDPSHIYTFGHEGDLVQTAPYNARV